MAAFCLLTGMNKHEYLSLTQLEINAFITMANKRNRQR